MLQRWKVWVSHVRRGRQARWAAALTAVLIGCLACTSGGSPRPSATDRPTTSAPVVGQRCTLDAKAVPSCGVLWGISTRPPTLQTLAKVEQAAGRPFDFMYRYHDVNDVVPDDVERQVVRDGRLLHIALAARDFSSASRAGITWADIAAGRYDDTLAAQARGVASLKVPVFMTFEQEASQRKKLDVAGTAKDFHRAWRHLHDLYVAAGATNAVWTWVMTGSPDNLDRALALWPGNDVVDWISWNVYNQSGCNGGTVSPDKFTSFEEKLRVFYDFMHEHGKASGIDVSKPMMISEAGSVQYDTAMDRTAEWYASIPGTLRRYPQIKAIALWDSATDSCNYDFDSVPQVREAVRQAGLDPWMSLHGALAPRG